jgi:hypothetical protein
MFRFTYFRLLAAVCVVAFVYGEPGARHSEAFAVAGIDPNRIISSPGTDTIRDASLNCADISALAIGRTLARRGSGMIPCNVDGSNDRNFRIAGIGATFPIFFLPNGGGGRFEGEIPGLRFLVPSDESIHYASERNTTNPDEFIPESGGTATGLVRSHLGIYLKPTRMRSCNASALKPLIWADNLTSRSPPHFSPFA